jgi:hypothetical protein
LEKSFFFHQKFEKPFALFLDKTKSKKAVYAFSKHFQREITPEKQGDPVVMSSHFSAGSIIKNMPKILNTFINFFQHWKVSSEAHFGIKFFAFTAGITM